MHTLGVCGLGAVVCNPSLPCEALRVLALFLDSSTQLPLVRLPSLQKLSQGEVIIAQGNTALQEDSAPGGPGPTPYVASPQMHSAY